MKRFIQGEHRGQSTLLPGSLDDYVSDTNPVRVVDFFAAPPCPSLQMENVFCRPALSLASPETMNTQLR
jgi:hypothetical protein